MFTKVVYLQCCLVVTWLVPRETDAASAQVHSTPYNHEPVYSVSLFEAIYVRCVCLATTCHMHLWQNDRDLLRWTDIEIRVSTESWHWWRKFSRRSGRDSNPRPFFKVIRSTTELSPVVCISLFKSTIAYYSWTQHDPRWASCMYRTVTFTVKLPSTGLRQRFSNHCIKWLCHKSLKTVDWHFFVDDPSIPQPVKFLALKMQGRACKQYIFRFYNTSSFSAMFCDESLFTCQCKKGDKKALNF